MLKIQSFSLSDTFYYWGEDAAVKHIIGSTTWESIAAPETFTWGHMLFQVYDKIWKLGGEHLVNSINPLLTQLYDPVQNTYTNGPNLPQALCGLLDFVVFLPLPVKWFGIST